MFGLFWFIAVVVCGVVEPRGAVLGAAVLYVMLPSTLDLDIQARIGV